MLFLEGRLLEPRMWNDRRIGMAGWRSLTGGTGLIRQDLRVSRDNRARSKFNQPILPMTNTSKRRKKMSRLQISIRLQPLEDGITIKGAQD
jgi:hypothetical protein